MLGNSGTDARFPSRVRQNVVVGWCIALLREQEGLSQRACSGGGEFLGEFLPAEYGMNVGKVRPRRSVSLGSTADYR